MDLRNRAFRNYNEEDAFDNIDRGLPPFLLTGTMPGPTATENVARTTSEDIITTTTASINTLNQRFEETDDLLTIKKESYKKLQVDDPALFQRITDRFLREIQSDIAHLEINEKREEDIITNVNICKQINKHLKELLEVIDDIKESEVDDANSSFTDFKVRFEVVISMTDVLLAKYEQRCQKTRNNLLQRLSRCPTPLQEARSSSRVHNVDDPGPARLGNQTSMNYTVLGQQPRLAGDPTFMNSVAGGNLQPEREVRGLRDPPLMNQGATGSSFQHGRPYNRRQDFYNQQEDDRNSMASDNSILDTISELTFDGSWRLCDYNGQNLTAITIHSAMMQIASITRTEVDKYTDECILKALDARDIPQLKDWQKIINKNIHKLPNNSEFKDLQVHAGHALKAAFKYIATVDKLVRDRGLHIKSDNTTASPLELEKFDGYESKNTNIFEFLTQLMLVCKGLQQKEVGEYLFCNYITPRIQHELMHIRHSFPEMKMFLLKKYGRINRLLRENKQKLREIIPPNSKTPKLAKIQYLNHVLEILQQMKSLVDHNKIDKPNVEHEIYNYDTIMDFVSYIAEPYKSGYIGEYVKVSSTSYEDEDLPGSLIFQILLKYIKGQVRKIELNIETSLIPNPDTDKKSMQTKTINTLEIEDLDEHSDVDEHAKPLQVNVANLQSVNDKGSSAKKKWVDDGKWHQATCYMHDATYKRVSDCRMGCCQSFLNAAPKERAKRADEKLRCKLCFMRKCKRSDPNNCMFHESIGQSLKCKACQVQGKHINVLLCEHHDSSANIVKTELVAFLAGYEMDMSINLLTLSILKLSKEKLGEITTTNQQRKNDWAYNVTDGSSTKKQEILHKINKDNGLEGPLFLLQTLNVGGQATLCMFDTGAGGEVCTTDLAEKLRLEVLDSREQFIKVASGKVMPTGGGIYRATLGPDPDDVYHEVSLTGMTRITGKINHYNLSDIVKELKINQSSTPLSKECFPPHIGGSEVGLLIGVKQSCLMPDLLMVLPSGISVWRSRLRDVHGSTIMFSGLHQSISNQAKILDTEPSAVNIMFSQEANRYLYTAHKTVSLSWHDDNIAPQVLQFDDGDTDIIEADVKDTLNICTCNILTSRELVQCYCDKAGKDVDDGLPQCNDEFKDPEYLMKFKTKVPRKIEQELADQEDIGSKVDFRCPQCQGCVQCKTDRRSRDTSIKEIEEEQLIKASIKVDTKANTTYAKYPFTRDPDSYLKERWHGRNNNYFMAIRTLDSVRRKPKAEKEGIIKFHDELLAKNYAIKVSDLAVELQEQIHNAPLRHYFPWKGVQKPGSSSTKHRMVTDPSVTEFNSVLAKGINCMNSLFEIVVEWRTYLYSATSDISKMFNSLKLEESEYRYSLYLFSPNLDLDESPELHAMTTVMYGLKCAGNQCTCALRQVSDEFKVECPRANRIVKDSTFMDDSGFGSNSKEDLKEIISEIETVLPRGGFQIKAINLSGEDPHESTSSDGINSTFAGYQWSQKLDLLSLNHGDINFHKKIRGYKKPNELTLETDDDLENLVKTQKFTRRILMGKVLEVYDLCGIAEPLKAKLKLDVRKLVEFDYDTEIPANLRTLWISNLKLIQKSRNLTWQRSVVPENAVDPDKFDLVCFVDAAQNMAGTCIYTRFLCKDGFYHCQLLLARSKCTDSTIPRNELCSALLGAQTLHIVMNRLGNRVTDYIVLTDSEICLFWITNPENRLKSYVFNRVQNIHRLLDKDLFYHVRTLDNCADILTRGDIELEDLDLGSSWQNGPDWLRLPVDQMPIRSPDSIRKSLTKEQEAHISRESQPKLTDEKIFPSINNMSASFSSLGKICCHNFNISAECHCLDEVKCCLCVYDPALLEIDLEYHRSSNEVIHGTVMHVNNAKRDKLADYIGLQYHGFQKSIRLLGLFFRFITKLIHQVHVKKGVINHKCRLCNADTTVKRNAVHKLTVKNMFIPTAYEIHLAWDFVCKQATNEVRVNVSSKKLLAYEEENGVLVSGGRLSYPDVLVDSPELPYLPDMNYKSPVALVKSRLVTSLAIYIHWDVLPHVGIEQQLSFMLKIVHVENLRFLIKRVRNECPRCRYLLKRPPIASTGNQSKLAMLKVPAFYAAMIDICGPFDAFTLIRQVKDRRSRKAYMLVFVCLTSSATNIHCIEDMTTESIASAIQRHSNRYGVAQFLLADNQSSFHVLEQVRVQFLDLQGHLWKNKRIILDFSTPLHHAGHGKVEVRVKLIREMLNTTLESCKEHSYLMWETVGSTIANMLNNMPIAHCSDRNGVDDPIFLVTPNSLLLGKNQNRSVSGPIELEDCYVNKQFSNVNEITELVQSQISKMAHKYVPGRKISKASPPLIGEIILFVMKESERSRNVQFKYGRVIENYVDGRENKIRIKYKNATEYVFREVCRHVNEIVVILSLEDFKFDTMHQQLLHELQLKHQ